MLCSFYHRLKNKKDISKQQQQQDDPAGNFRGLAPDLPRFARITSRVSPAPTHLVGDPLAAHRGDELVVRVEANHEPLGGPRQRVLEQELVLDEAVQRRDQAPMMVPGQNFRDTLRRPETPEVALSRLEWVERKGV